MMDLSYKKDVDVIVDQLVVCLEAHIRDSISSALPQENFFDFLCNHIPTTSVYPALGISSLERAISTSFSAWAQGGVSVRPWGIKQEVLMIVSARRVCRYSCHGWERPHSRPMLHAWTSCHLSQCRFCLRQPEGHLHGRVWRLLISRCHGQGGDNRPSTAIQSPCSLRGISKPSQGGSP